MTDIAQTATPAATVPLARSGVRVHDGCRLVAATPPDAHHLFGFHDLTPFDGTDRRLALLRCRDPFRDLPDGRQEAEVCIWDLDDDRIEVVDVTTTWNWQMGCRLQWRKDGRRLLYNKLVDGRRRGVTLDPATGETTVHGFTVFDVAADDRTAISPHFGRLHRYYPSYGHPGSELPPGADDPAPEDDGLYRVDLETGEVELIVSVREIAEADKTAPKDAKHFLSHTFFAPQGTDFLFFHRQRLLDGGLHSRLCRYADGKVNVVAEGHVSHYDWLDEHHILLYCSAPAGRLGTMRRFGISALPGARQAMALFRSLHPRLKAAVLGRSYVVVDVRTGERGRRLDQAKLDQDGHPMFAPDDFDWMVSDTYADSNEVLRLFLYNLSSETLHGVADIQAAPFWRGFGDKRDLHPRFDRSGRRVAIDSTDGDRCSVLVFDVGGVRGE